MTKKQDHDFEQPGFNDVIDFDEDDESFDIGQGYEKEAAKTVKCKICGSNSFTVGMGDFYTALKCEECKWQLCVHDG